MFDKLFQDFGKNIVPLEREIELFGHSHPHLEVRSIPKPIEKDNFKPIISVEEHAKYLTPKMKNEEVKVHVATRSFLGTTTKFISYVLVGVILIFIGKMLLGRWLYFQVSDEAVSINPSAKCYKEE